MVWSDRTDGEDSTFLNPERFTRGFKTLIALTNSDIGTIELRLQLSETSRLRQQFTGWRSSKLQHVWHDTPAGEFAKSNIALAQDLPGWSTCPVRRAGPSWAADTTWFVSPESTAHAALGREIHAPVVPLVMLVGERWDVEILTHPIKVCLLEGRWETLTAASPCCRLFVQGPELEVAELVERLAQSFPLTLPAAGLDDEAMAFARGEAPMARRLGIPRLSEGLTAEQGFVDIVSHLTEVMVFWESRVPQGKLVDPSDGDEICEAVHQIRVALRRLRSAFRAFRAFMPCVKLQALKPDIRRFAQMLGPPRDWDVFIAETLNDVITALPNEPALMQLRRAALRRRHDAYGALNRYLAEGEFSRLAVSLACLTWQKPWELEADDMVREAQRTPLATFGAHILRRRHRHILTQGGRLLDESCEDCSSSDLHNLRLQCKQMRYLAEFFAPVFVSKAAPRFIRRLADVQGNLGHINDAAVAAELMISLPTVTRRAQGIVQGFIAGRIGDWRAELAESWKRFRKQDEFW